MKLTEDFKTFLVYMAINVAVTVLVNYAFLWQAMWLFKAIVPFELAIFTLLAAMTVKQDSRPN